MPTPQPLWTDTAQAIGTVLGTLVAFFGFVVLIYQIHQLRNAIEAETHDRLYGQGRDVLRAFVDNPTFRPYFYENLAMTPTDEHYQKLLAFTELFTDYLDHISIQRSNLPDDISKCWERYIKGFFHTSPILREYLGKEKDCYSPQLHALYESSLVEVSSAGGATRDAQEAENKAAVQLKKGSAVES